MSTLSGVVEAFRLVKSADPKLPYLIMSGGLANSLVSAVQVQLFSLLINSISETPTISRVTLPLLIFAYFIANAVGGIVWSYLDERQDLGGLRVERATSLALVDHVASCDPSMFENSHFLDTLQRLQEGLGMRPAQLVRGLASVFYGIGGALGAFIALYHSSSRAAALVSVVLLIPIAATLWARRVDAEIFDETVETQRRSGYLSFVALSRRAAPENYGYAFFIPVRQTIASLMDELIETYWSHRKGALAKESFGLLVMAMAAVLLFATQIDGSEFALMLLGFQRLEAGFAAAGGGAGDVARSIGFVRSGLEIQAIPGELKANGAYSDRKPKEMVRSLQLPSVSFRYDPDGPLVVDALTLRADRGDICVLSGRNGAGKSTVLSIIAGLLHREGAVLFDGRPTAVTERLAMCALAPQRSFQYELPLELVVSGKATMRADHLKWRSIFGVDKIAGSLPNGYDTDLGRSFSGALDISAGQWQRISLCRAFSKDASILLLDEPSSYLDFEFLAALETAIAQASQDRIVVIASHEPRILDMATQVVEL